MSLCIKAKTLVLRCLTCQIEGRLTYSLGYVGSAFIFSLAETDYMSGEVLGVWLMEGFYNIYNCQK